VQFSPELRGGVLAGDVTVSVRLWTRPQVKVGGRYRVGPGEVEIDLMELVPFGTISSTDALRARAAHAGPIDDATMVYRLTFHLVGSPPGDQRTDPS
jgi:hypothetical protein